MVRYLIPRPGFPAGSRFLVYLAVYLGAALLIVLVVTALGLPNRMGCAVAGGKRLNCQHGLFSPETWKAKP